MVIRALRYTERYAGDVIKGVTPIWRDITPATRDTHCRYATPGDIHTLMPTYDDIVTPYYYATSYATLAIRHYDSLLVEWHTVDYAVGVRRPFYIT